MIVIDASAVIPYVLYKDHVVELTILEADRIISPELYVSECGNTLLQYVKKTNITVSESQNYLRQCLNVPDQIINLNENSDQILKLAFDNHLSYYDAQYLFLALVSQTRLLSRDNRLNKSAEKYGLKY